LAVHSRPTQDLSPVILNVRADDFFAFNRETVPRQDSAARLTAVYATRGDKMIFLEADRSPPYGRVVMVMDECRPAGVTAIGAIGQKPAAQ
jgi:biopolymer transport protein ExbD